MGRGRVVVTGIGPLSPQAAGCERFWRLFRGGLPNADPAAPGPAPVWRCGEPESRSAHCSPALRQMHRLGRLAVAAAAFALEDAELELADLDGDDVGVAFGTGYGCLAANLEYLEGIVARGSRLGNPVVFQNTVPNAAAGYVAIAHGIRGPNATFSSGWIAGLEALDFSVQQIFENQVHTMIVASADHLCSPLIEGFANRGQISRDGV